MLLPIEIHGNDNNYQECYIKSKKQDEIAVYYMVVDNCDYI
jgi:hypothetical protein